MIGIPASLLGSLGALGWSRWRNRKLMDVEQQAYQLLVIADAARRADTAELERLEDELDELIRTCVNHMTAGTADVSQAPITTLAIDHARRAIERRRQDLAATRRGKAAGITEEAPRSPVRRFHGICPVVWRLRRLDGPSRRAHTMRPHAIGEAALKQSYLTRKTIDDVDGDAILTRKPFDAALGRFSLTALGVGAIIGAGIFVLTGAAAARYAGPAVVLSFALAGFACAIVALCYAELAALIPVSGSTYSYVYIALGEIFAWIIGWDLVLEYAMGAATVAVGWSGYLTSLLASLGLHLPPQLTAPVGPGFSTRRPRRSCWSSPAC